MITFDQRKGIYISSIISAEHGFGTKQFGDGRNKQSIIKQTHSTNIHLLTSQSNKIHNNCDGIITKEKNTELSVITADCVPIIFHDPLEHIIAISHQGWKGTLERMPQKMIAEMKQLGSNVHNIKVAIGPAINSCCYIVNKERADKFASQFNNQVVQYDNKQYSINLIAANYQQLIEMGMNKRDIDYFPFCTSCNKEKFWSFRRDKGIIGEMYTYIKE